MSGHKLLRIEEDIKRVLASVFLERKLDIIPEIISIIDVKVTPDLMFGKVYVSILSSGETAKDAVGKLNKSAGFFRHEISKRVKMRVTPEISFVLDDSIAYGTKISKIINDLKR